MCRYGLWKLGGGVYKYGGWRWREGGGINQQCIVTSRALHVVAHRWFGSMV